MVNALTQTAVGGVTSGLHAFPVMVTLPQHLLNPPPGSATQADITKVPVPAIEMDGIQVPFTPWAMDVSTQL